MTTMSVQQIADQVVSVMRRHGAADYSFTDLRLLLHQFEEQGASRETVAAAIDVAAKRFRDEAKAKFDHANALEAWRRSRKVK